jgi:antitoxin (DNA-binding transcriptional repressor) of toxin-antitoxin stability system
MNGGSPGEDAISDVNSSTIVTMPARPVLRIIAVQRSERSITRVMLAHYWSGGPNDLALTGDT